MRHAGLGAVEAQKQRVCLVSVLDAESPSDGAEGSVLGQVEPVAGR